jgi:hypothetical protein
MGIYLKEWKVGPNAMKSKLCNLDDFMFLLGMDIV